ncbi:BgtE-10022 [Blumeria graminis f. sp. tritici]|uniref:BgtE-10022 n=3 Tax=Blumeria graminis TaxID=34373 RepID=A0A061HN17_BLUGR|nr:putative secreted effector protein [Blumeria graminis f. sp. tritici 96224]VDB91383.1 BgtE-10022 [Blumeria graminis f. sp. tritici]
MWNNRVLYSYNFYPISSPHDPFQYFTFDYGENFVTPFGKWLRTFSGKLLHFNRSPIMTRVSASGKYCAEDEKGYAVAYEYISQKARLERSQVRFRDKVDSDYNRCVAELSSFIEGSIISFSMVKEGSVPYCRVKHLVRYIMSRESLILDSTTQCEERKESVCFVADMALAAEDILDSYHHLTMAKMGQANTYLVSIAGKLYITIDSGTNNEYLIFTRNRRQSDDEVIQYLIQNESNEIRADIPNFKLARFRIF